jgi:putative addiction module antidote
MAQVIRRFHLGRSFDARVFHRSIVALLIGRLDTHYYLDTYAQRSIHAMAVTLKLTAVGTSTGVVIPKEMLNRMKVERGDALHVIETPDGYLITPYDPEVARQIDAGREFMKEYRDTFKVLAK